MPEVKIPLAVQIGDMIDMGQRFVRVPEGQDNRYIKAILKEFKRRVPEASPITLEATSRQYPGSNGKRRLAGILAYCTLGDRQYRLKRSIKKNRQFPLKDFLDSLRRMDDMLVRYNVKTASAESRTTERKRADRYNRHMKYAGLPYHPYTTRTDGLCRIWFEVLDDEEANIFVEALKQIHERRSHPDFEFPDRDPATIGKKKQDDS